MMQQQRWCMVITIGIMMTMAMVPSLVVSHGGGADGWSAEPYAAKLPDGPFNFTVPHQRLAVIVPFTTRTIPLLVQTLSLWSGPDFTPCVPHNDDPMSDEELAAAHAAHDALLPSGMPSRYPPAMVDLCNHDHSYNNA